MGVPAAGWEPWIRKNRETELRKTVSVQESLRDREVVLAEQRQQESGQWIQVCKVWGAVGSIHMQCSPLQFFLPTFVGSFFFSQNSYLLEQASCQNVAIQMFVLDPGCDVARYAAMWLPVAQLCWVSQPPQKWQETQSWLHWKQQTLTHFLFRNSSVCPLLQFSSLLVPRENWYSFNP